MWVELLIFVFLLIFYFIMRDRRPAGMPPGPFEIPFLGCSPVFEEKAALKLREQYGDIVSIRLGELRSILIFDAALGKEVLSMPVTAGRPHYFRTFSVDDLKMGGIVGGVGSQWQHDRRFVLRNLRNLGMGKSYLEDAINFEAQAMVDDLKKYNEEPIKFPDTFKTCPLNVIWQMVASTRYDLRSTEVDRIYKISKEAQSLSFFTFLPAFFPSATKMIPKFIIDRIFSQGVFEKYFEETRALVEKSIKEHEEDSDPDNPNDLIDEYLKEMKAHIQEGNHDLFRRGALMQIISDLFQAGSDTIYSMLKWVSYLLARYPEVAEKMQKEIDQVVARDRLVSLDDKPDLPYVEAFANEALRFASIIPMNVEHQATEDTAVNGYFVPKGTLFVVCSYHCHFDPKYWTDPQEFKPERFLNDEGKFQSPKVGFFAFGQGRRQCVGETLARMELFLFTAAIAQNFSIEVPAGVNLPDEPVNQIGLRLPEDIPLIYRSRK